ncbi:Glycosyltransferase 61 [Gracilaria domingensis]|nr:Glycosyltransferase 61 [Gracilaria domingensis]
MHATTSSAWAHSSRLLPFLLALCIILITPATILIASRFQLFTHTKFINTTVWQGSYRPLSQQWFYREQFITPPSAGANSTEEAIERLHKIVSNALAVRTGRLGNVWPQKGITFTSSFVNDDYQQAKSLVNQLCEPAFVNIPKTAPNISPMCLSVFENSYIGPSGVVYEPKTNLLHDMAGGCCVFDWVRYTDDAIPLRYSPTRIPIVLSMGFHHAVTYHHVIHELLPRILPFFPLLDAEPHILIAIDESAVTERLLSVLGIDSSRLIPIKLLKSTWIHGAIVLQPPPLFLCRSNWNCVTNATRVTTNILRDATISKEAYEEVFKERPKLILLERARSRRKDGSCREQRCAKNLGELRDALQKEYGKQFEITVVPPKMSVIETIKTFAVADVIVGLHGAGFQNMMYCSKGTTVVHIGWGRHYEDLAQEFDLNYHLSRMPSLTRNSRNVQIDVKRIMADVRNAINLDRNLPKTQIRQITS